MKTNNLIIKKLRESLANFDTPVLITDANIDGGGPFIVFANKGFEKMTGYTEEELLGKAPRILQGSMTNKKILSKLKKSLIEDLHFSDSAINYKKDGTIFYNQWGIESIKNSEGTITHYISLHTDITNLRQKEFELQISEQKLQEEIKLKNKFFSIIAHDLRNPISGFLTLTELLKVKGYDMSINQMMKMVGQLNDAASNLNELLGNLLTWSRSQTNKINVNIENISPKKEVDSIINLLKMNIDLKEIEVKNTINPEMVIASDIYIFQTCVRNLISNSIKFTPKKGKIDISSNQNGDWNEIRISDNGIGISEEDLNKIFNFAEKLSKKGTDGEKGTGLGLKLVSDLLKLQNSNMELNSKLGKGTEVILKFNA